LAKELGVKSTAIVKKCQDEGLDVKNHMSTISAGLAATIREWFSEGERTTSVETTEKVDLKKVRIKKKKKKKPAAKKKAKAKKPKPKEKPRDKTAEAAAILEEKPPKPKEKIIPKPKKPPKPKPVKPAGPKLKKPKPAKLTGPTVIRVEQAESPVAPKPKSRIKYNEPVTEPLIADEYKDERLGLGQRPREARRYPHRRKDRVHRRGKDDSFPEEVRKLKYLTIRRQKDIEERRARLDAAGGERLRLRPVRKIETRAQLQAPTVVRPIKAIVSEPVAIKDLSAALGIKSADIISKLIEQGIMATTNEVLSNEVAELIAMDFGCELTIEHKGTTEEQVEQEFEQYERKSLKPRPVVATMLGHVDHGKTSLLDKIRSTTVTASEAGGITQHIGAYQVDIGNSKVTFLDTPGHEAFTEMRARGANMTDVVVLVIAADDGVMPQTIEAIAHSKAAKVSVIVALNKIDLPGVDTNRIYAQLAEYDLTPVEWGGETDIVKTSAVTGQGINDLLEHIDYLRQVLDLKADDTIPATGWVVEAKMSPTRGAVATLLLKEGQLSKGDVVLAGATYGKVKNIKDSFGKNIKTAIPSMPVEITGLNGVPQAGNKFYSLGNDLVKAKEAADENQSLSRLDMLTKRTQITLDNLFSQIEAGNVKELNIIIRADVQGSVDVLIKYLTELSTEEVKIKIIHASPGGITEGDVVLAEASNAIIIGFNVTADERVQKIIDEKGVEIRLYNIIYRITEDLKKSMEGMLEPDQKEKTIGRATIRETFKVSRLGTIAGCHVNDGFARKNAKVRLIRNNVITRDGLTIESLKHFKDDVREVKAGMDCGIKIARFDDVKIDDVLEFYEIVEVARTL